jgi:hypothetical protein
LVEKFPDVLDCYADGIAGDKSKEALTDKFDHLCCPATHPKQKQIAIAE